MIASTEASTEYCSSKQTARASYTCRWAWLRLLGLWLALPCVLLNTSWYVSACDSGTVACCLCQAFARLKVGFIRSQLVPAWSNLYLYIPLAGLRIIAAALGLHSCGKRTSADTWDGYGSARTPSCAARGEECKEEGTSLTQGQLLGMQPGVFLRGCPARLLMPAQLQVTPLHSPLYLSGAFICDLGSR